jgi:acetyltransferase-like isoleucine patch superfamily enzyme
MKPKLDMVRAIGGPFIRRIRSNRFLFSMCELFLTTMADWEVRRGVTGLDGKPQKWRARHLRLMRIPHGKHFTIGYNILIRNRGNLTLGERCVIGSFTRIWNYAPISIGEDFGTAGGLTMNSATHDPVTLRSEAKPIRIGNRVWCGVNVTILAGVTIGDDVVIGAGAVVTKNIPDNSIAVGVPAKKVKVLNRPPGTAFDYWANPVPGSK